jgi:hypothetical protein
VTAPNPVQPDVALEALALIEWRLRRDDEAFTYLLGIGSNRGQASVLADLLAGYLARLCPDPLAAVALLREAVLAARDEAPGEPA